MKKKTIIYVDGYNWYHGIFKHRPEWKWLNIQSFFEALRPHEDIISVKMFSAWIFHDLEAQERQKRYFDALQTLPKVKLVMGVFQPRTVTCRGDCKVKYEIQEEKKTDVNLAVEIMDDCLSGICEQIIVVSGDSDIQPSVEWVAKKKPEIKITVLVPSLPVEQGERRTDYYAKKRLNVECKFLPINGLKDNQLKHTIKIGDGKFAARPHVWSSPADLQQV